MDPSPGPGAYDNERSMSRERGTAAFGFGKEGRGGQ